VAGSSGSLAPALAAELGVPQFDPRMRI